ncbi:hypothetical protein CALVIDRAFT_551102 [Calocera viscosa TUFC12733]|uniref:Vesicle tethering protein Uso1/P115-like head domain-containing protein n=1 Tax=Calocera viscosa (strain TUFC12733) TaxID=1330018 RepID=A0A167I4H9_CALVF|nr:hypothetical protein CALVIDRAFT_551102 [Calocera viscosa TUFC12733]
MARRRRVRVGPEGKRWRCIDTFQSSVCFFPFKFSSYTLCSLPATLPAEKSKMDFLSATYKELRAQAQTQLQSALTPQTQTMQSTIDKLTDRLLQSEQLADRRASLLALKGLSRDAKREVGETALMALLGSLDRDAQADPEAGKAVLETLLALCERDEVDPSLPQPTPAAQARGKGREDLGLRHTDVVLQSPEPVHTLVRLLGQTNFYIRFTTLQLLGVLLANRGQQVQNYVLGSPQGVGSLVGVLQERREIIRNEALLLLQNLIAQNADLQKIVAFEGAFERLLDIAQAEGGVEGGVVAQDCLLAIELLLRFNVSNQNYFRETSNIPRLPPLLLFPHPSPAPTEPSPQSFALQFWDAQKLANATAVVRLVQVLLGGVGAGKEQNQLALLASGMTRCLVELGLASNAPTSLKIHALNALSTLLASSRANQQLLASLSLTPYAWAGGDEWDRLPSQSSVTSLIRTAISGDLGAAVLTGGGEAEREGLECRAAAVQAFDAFVTGNKEGVEGVLAELAFPPDGTDTTPFADPPLPAGVALLHALTALPSPEVAPPSLNGLPPARFNTYPTLFACHLFAHLLRSSEAARASARSVALPLPSGPPGEEEEDEQPPTLVQVLIGNVNLALREQLRAREEGRQREGREWDRACVGWMQVLCTWLWESPGSVREFLSEGGNVQVLVGPITQASGVDPLVQGLAAFLLGTCYEFNTDPGEITRATLHPILLKHVGADQFVNRMTRLREDERFKSVTPDSAVVGPGSGGADGAGGGGGGGGMQTGQGERPPEAEVWFDWSFVEFWKNTYFSVQRAITSDPNAIKPPAGESPQTLALISSLQETIKSQAKDLEAMQRKLDALHREREEERDTLGQELDRLNRQVAEMSEELQLAAGRERSKEGQMREKEREIDALKQELVDASFAPGAAGATAAAAAQPDPALQAHLTQLEQQFRDAQARIKEQEEQVEDAFVALDELSQKRRRDKKRMKEAKLEVSEDEDEEDEEDDEDVD